VDKDLLPLHFPYSADVLEGRALVSEETEWGQAVPSLYRADMGPSGADQAGWSIPSVSHMMANEGLPPSATGPRIITVSLPTHRDIQEHMLDSFWHAPPSAFGDVLVPFLGLDQRAVERLHMSTLLAAPLHTPVRQGVAVRTRTEEQVGMSTDGAADHLERFGRDALREVVLREVDTVEDGPSHGGHAGVAPVRGQVRARENSAEGDQAGPAQRYRSGPSSWWKTVSSGVYTVRRGERGNVLHLCSCAKSYRCLTCKHYGSNVVLARFFLGPFFGA